MGSPMRRSSAAGGSPSRSMESQGVVVRESDRVYNPERYECSFREDEYFGEVYDHVSNGDDPPSLKNGGDNFYVSQHSDADQDEYSYSDYHLTTTTSVRTQEEQTGPPHD